MSLKLEFPHNRLRRTRQSKWIRNLVQENILGPNDLIWPIFVCDGKNIKSEIKTMPDVYRYSVDNLNEVFDIACKEQINLVAIFPYTPEDLKSNDGREGLNPNNLVCKSLKKLRDNSPNFGLMCDVALDPYTIHGHDGIVKNGKILNDETNQILIKQSLLQASMGCDIIAPSDMMDGRIGLIRKNLDKNNLSEVQILSYSAKYSSSYYGPFRDAIGSKGLLKGNKKTYQMNYKNSNEALREVALDIKEGADLIMIKPGLPYLDIIYQVKKKFKIPVIAYQVSGEYAILSNAIQKGVVREDAILETLMSFKRAGATAIVTYFADKIAKIL